MSGLEDLLEKVIEGDCLNIMPSIPDGSIDMILTDLPYGTTGIVWDIAIDLAMLWKQYERVIKSNGVIALSSQGIFTGKLIMSNERLFKYKLVWVKSTPTNFLNAKKAPMRRHEDICIFYKGQPTYHPHMEQGKSAAWKLQKRDDSDSFGKLKAVPGAKKSRYRFPTDVLFYEPEEEGILDSVYFKNASAEGGTVHPTQKPEALARYLIRTFTDPGQVVLDSACGSGSFLVAAVKEGRRFIGIEKNDHAVHKGRFVNYIDLSRRRLEKAYRWREEEDKKLSLF